ncbi:NADase-type glycan-binding domain-containing protein [Streptomyces sp. NPDC021098]|uniref:NADase-type glycan-binding domain-containing protein n=1 Tax=unclassified Streptomyces TaxID=2593676 RepID=UPI0037A917B6
MNASHHRTCTECGAARQDNQSFCDECGAFLGWEEDTASTPGAQRAQKPTPSAPDRDAPEAGRPQDATRDAPHAAAADDTALGTPATASDTTPTTTADAAPAAAENAATPARDADERARALIVPVADPSASDPAADGIAPVLPGTPRADAPRARAVAPEEAPQNGIACPWCDTSNQPHRHFCRQCAMRLAETPAQPVRPRLPWWRRILGLRGDETPFAGDRPRLRRGVSGVVSMVVGLLVVTAVVVAAVIWTGPAVAAVQDHFSKRALIHPSTVTATHSDSSHLPQKADDGKSNTWWGTGYSGDSSGQAWEANFSGPTRLLDVVITPGVSTKPDEGRDQSRPRQIEVQLTRSDGETEKHELNLNDGSEQTFPLRAKDVVRARLQIKSAYAEPDKQVAVAEVEFFGPSTNNDAA